MTIIKDIVILILLVGTLFGTTIGQYPLAAPDGARYAEIPREMVTTGDYITPHLNGVKYLEKPPLFYWMQSISIKALGTNEFSVSLANGIMGLATCLLIYLTGRKLFSRLSAVLGSLVLATMALMFALTRIVTLDLTLTFFITATLSCFIIAMQLPLGWKRNLYLLVMYALAGFAVMTKGLVGIILPGSIILLWLMFFNEWRNLKNLQLFSGTIIFLLVALPWHILVQIKNPEFSRFYFIEQHFLRYLTPYAGRGQKWFFLPIVFCAGLYPWLFFLPQTIWQHLPKSRATLQQYRPAIFLLLWPAIIYLFYSFSDSKLIPYLLPTLPPLALLIGNYFANIWQQPQTKSLHISFNLTVAINLIAGIAALIAIFMLDFNEQAITKAHLYPVGLTLIIGAITTFIIYQRYGTILGFYSLTLVTAILWLNASPAITIINRQSIKPLIITLQQKLQPTEEVIAFGNYYQDLPFYLQRKITVANYAGELAFGMQHQDTKSWMIDGKTFWQRWLSPNRVYMIVATSYYQKLKVFVPHRLRIVAKHLDDLLVTNDKS